MLAGNSCSGFPGCWRMVVDSSSALGGVICAGSRFVHLVRLLSLRWASLVVFADVRSHDSGLVSSPGL